MKPGPGVVARAVAGGLVARRLAVVARPSEPIGVDATCLAGVHADISVVVPARDEASRIGPLLDAVVGGPRVAEVIVVDDESTDGTAELARAAGATVVAGRARPPGWAGKTWALQQGLDAATQPVVVTFDADVRPDPHLPAALARRLADDRIDLLTVGGRFDCPTAPSRWLHASMLTTLVYRFGPPGGATASSGERLLANGQCMVFRTDVMRDLDGFGTVAESVVEDVALARWFARHGRSVAFLDASDLMAVRMFESLSETWTGWGRSLGLPGVEPVGRRMLDVITLALTMPVPLVRLVARRGDPLDVVLLVMRAGTLAGTRTAYDRTDLAYWLSPLADGLSVAALATGLARRRQTWRGRTYLT